MSSIERQALGWLKLELNYYNNMVIDITLKKDYSEIKFLYKKNEIEYYKLSIILYSVGESHVCLSHVYDRVPTDIDKINLYSEYLG